MRYGWVGFVFDPDSYRIGTTQWRSLVAEQCESDRGRQERGHPGQQGAHELCRRVRRHRREHHDTSAVTVAITASELVSLWIFARTSAVSVMRLNYVLLFIKAVPRSQAQCARLVQVGTQVPPTTPAHTAPQAGAIGMPATVAVHLAVQAAPASPASAAHSTLQ